jgi:hypothetical protein
MGLCFNQLRCRCDYTYPWCAGYRDYGTGHLYQFQGYLPAQAGSCSGHRF